MKRYLPLMGVLVCFLVVLLPAAASAGDHAYVGPKKCKMCHSKPEQGEQYAKWKAGPHAKAYEELASEKALEVAKEKGIDNPQEADECLKCHVTGHGVSKDLLGKKWKAEDGVTCEGCHGFGGDYYKMSVMKDPEKAKAAGLQHPDEKTCVACHNEGSPTYKPFDYAERSKEIAHPKPAG